MSDEDRLSFRHHVASSAAVRLRPSGKFNPLSLLVIGGVAYGLWWMFTFVGVYLDNLDVKDGVNGAFNESPRSSDPVLISHILGKANASTTGEHEEEQPDGTIKVVPGIGLKEEDVTITRDDVASTIRIAVAYQRKVVLKPTTKVKFVQFSYVKEGPIPWTKN